MESLTRAQIEAKIPELEKRNFWYWTMKAGVKKSGIKSRGGNNTYLYSLNAIDKIKKALNEAREEMVK